MSADSLTWQGNARAMYDKMISLAPVFMREKVRKRFDEWVAEKGVDVVSETDLVDHINETVPPQFKGMLLSQLASLKA